MNYCKNTTIIVNAPVSIDEKDLYKHDPSRIIIMINAIHITVKME